MSTANGIATSRGPTGRPCRRRASRPPRGAPSGEQSAVSAINGPVRLSGRRCQTIRPQKTNEPPTKRLTRATAVTPAAVEQQDQRGELRRDADGPGSPATAPSPSGPFVSIATSLNASVPHPVRRGRSMPRSTRLPTLTAGVHGAHRRATRRPSRIRPRLASGTARWIACPAEIWGPNTFPVPVWSQKRSGCCRNDVPPDAIVAQRRAIGTPKRDHAATGDGLAAGHVAADGLPTIVVPVAPSSPTPMPDNASKSSSAAHALLL